MEKEIENNILIAKFMGYEKCKCESCVSNKKDLYITGSFLWSRTEPKNFEYKTNWNELMEVVEKIESLKCEVSIINKYCQITRYDLFTRGYIEGKTKIDAVYNAIISFIVIYNKHNENN